MIGVSESRPRWPDSSNPPSGEPGAVQFLHDSPVREGKETQWTSSQWYSRS